MTTAEYEDAIRPPSKLNYTSPRYGKVVLRFHCPGCNDTHDVEIPRWNWNGSMEAPTFSPSVLVRTGHYCVGVSEDVECWCTYNSKHPDNPAPFKCYLCHSFVRGGMIEFLSDCTHELAGKTVPMPDWESSI